MTPVPAPIQIQIVELVEMSPLKKALTRPKTTSVVARATHSDPG